MYSSSVERKGRKTKTAQLPPLKKSGKVIKEELKTNKKRMETLRHSVADDPTKR